MNNKPSNNAGLSLVPPVLKTGPLPDYERLDYGMTIGIERTPKGRLWACWVGGGDNDKAFFVVATSDDDGENWSRPCLVIDAHDDSQPYACRTIVGTLWTDPLGRLWLFFDLSLTFFDGRAGTWFTRCDQPDAEVPTWTDPVRIWHGCVLNKPVVRSNGEWLLTISLWDRGKIAEPFSDAFHELDEWRMANVFASSDEGQTWTRRGGARMPNPEFDEAHVVERIDGNLWMTARSTTGLRECESHDGGKTWSEPRPSVIANVNSRHFLRRLKSGRLLLVKHGNKIDERPSDVPYALRSQLTAFLSDDDGATWKGGLALDQRAGISYPDGTQAPDGTIFLSYDYNRDTNGEILMARFTEEDVLAGRCVSPRSRLRMLISQPDILAVATRLARENKIPALT